MYKFLFLLQIKNSIFHRYLFHLNIKQFFIAIFRQFLIYFLAPDQVKIAVGTSRSLIKGTHVYILFTLIFSFWLIDLNIVIIPLPRFSFSVEYIRREKDEKNILYVFLSLLMHALKLERV